MSAETVAVARSWTVGKYICTLTVPRPRPGAAVACSIEWEPEQPRRLTEAEIAEYRAGRNAALKALGVRALVVEV
jgi:hypothetical protein